MKQTDVITKLCRIVDPAEAVFAITMETILLAIAQRLGEEALTLSVDDLLLAREEVKAAIDHYLDEQEYIDIGLDAWEVVRTF